LGIRNCGKKPSGVRERFIGMMQKEQIAVPTNTESRNSLGGIHDDDGFILPVGTEALRQSGGEEVEEREVVMEERHGRRMKDEG